MYSYIWDSLYYIKSFVLNAFLNGTIKETVSVISSYLPFNPVPLPGYLKIKIHWGKLG